MAKITLEQGLDAIQEIQADIAEIKKRYYQPIETKKKKALLIVPEAAEFLNLSKATIYRLVSDREIPFHKQGSKLYFIEAELLDWVKSGREL